MKNVKMTVDAKGILTIIIDTKERLGRSASGKTEIIATTSGNVSIPGDDAVKIGINVYTK